MAKEGEVSFKRTSAGSGVVSVWRASAQLGHLDDQGNFCISGFSFSPADLQKVAERGILVAEKMRELIDPT